MAVRTIKKSWWVDIRFGHTRYRKRSPENSRKGAEAYEAFLRSKLARGESIDGLPQGQSQTFEAFTKKWYQDYVIPNNKPAEHKAKHHMLTASLVPFFGHMLLENIGANEIEQYKSFEQRRGVSNKTINNKLAVLRKCLVSANEWGHLKNALPKIRALKCMTPKTDYLTKEECEKLLAHTEGTLHEMVLLGLRTGMRQAEITGLQWESIDWQNKVIVVRHSLCAYTKELSSTKSNRERSVPLTDDLYGTLFFKRKSSGYVFTDIKGKAFSGQNALRLLQGAQKVATLRKFGWHTLRHTVASQLAAKGVSLRTVQEILGHSALNMTMRYSHVSAENLRDAVKVLV